MPILVSRFQPPALLGNGHIQTVLPLLLPRRLSITFERERLELDDGDFLDLDWARIGGDKLVILSHGLEGCSDDGYNRGMAAALHATGWDALAWNLRGCGKEMNRLPRFYHSGETGDLGASARQYLDRLTVPTLLFTPECFPFAEAEQNSSLFFEAPESGGHVGFVDLIHGSEPWSERRVVEFLATSMLAV